MRDFDSQIIRLQYEILNVPVSQLAKESGISESMLNETINSEGWKQWWPEEDSATYFAESRLKTIQDAKDRNDGSDPSDDDIMAQQSEQYVDRARKRLQVYSLAKEIYLAQKYLQLEVSLIQKAHEIITNSDAVDSYAVKQLSALYKDLVSKSPMSSLLSFSQDENGIPNLIIRDLSGR